MYKQKKSGFHVIRKLRPVVAVAATALALSAYAEADQFLLLSGIDGETQDPIYKGGIDVLAWSWGMSQSGTTHQGGSGGPGNANFADVSVTKYVDTSSVELYRHVSAGNLIDYGVLKIQESEDSPFISEEMVMYEVLVTSASTGGSGGETRLTENITLNFASFCIKHTEQLPGGDAGPKSEFCWNIVAGEPCTAAQLEPLIELRLTMSLPMDKLLRMNPVCRET